MRAGELFCKQILFLGLCLCAAPFSVRAQIPAPGGVTYPESYYAFRDNMYNSLGKTAAQFEAEHKAVTAEINSLKSGNERQVLLARCDYVLGRAYRYLGDGKAAAECFDRAIESCKEILKNEEMAEAYVVYADSISQNCSVRSKAYAMTQGPKIRSMARKALELDPGYGAALYLLNSQNIFTPPPFCDYDEGMRNLNLLLEGGGFRMDKSDYYNAMTARGYGYLQQGMAAESKIWYEKALEIYPGNVAALETLRQIERTLANNQDR